MPFFPTESIVLLTFPYLLYFYLKNIAHLYAFVLINSGSITGNRFPPNQWVGSYWQQISVIKSHMPSYTAQNLVQNCYFILSI